MYTQTQKALSILLLTSLLLQSCGTNLMLGEHRSEMRKQKEEATQQAPLPSAEPTPPLRAPLHSQPKTGHASVSPPLQPEASQVPPYTPKDAWKARQQRLGLAGSPDRRGRLVGGAGSDSEGAGEEKDNRPSPTEGKVEREDDEDEDEEKEEEDARSAWSDSGEEQPIALRDIHNTELLAKALKAVQDPREQRLLQQSVAAYLAAFNREAVGNLTQPGRLEAYSYLVNAVPEESIVEYFDNLKAKYAKARRDLHTLRPFMETFEYIFQNTDISAWRGNVAGLTKFSGSLISELEGASLDRDTYEAYRPLLCILHHTLMLIQSLTREPWDPDRAPYKGFLEQLQRLKTAAYYPFQYHALLIEQSLVRSATREAAVASAPRERLQAKIKQGKKALQRLGKGVRGVVYIFRGLRALAALDLDIDNFEAGYKKLVEAFAKEGIQRQAWYDELQQLTSSTLGSLAEASEYASFVACFNDLQSRAWGSEAERKALRYGMVSQLRELALRGAVDVRRGSHSTLTLLQEDETWVADPDIREAVAESLAAVAAQPAGEVDSAALEAVNDPLFKKVRHILNPSKPSVPSIKRINFWVLLPVVLAIIACIVSLYPPNPYPGPSLSQSVLDMGSSPVEIFAPNARVVLSPGPLEPSVPLGPSAARPYSQLLSHIAQAKLKDYVPREAEQMQLKEHLASRGVCVLSGHGGVGKSTLAAEYAHQQKGQHSTVYWLSAETPSKLLEGLEQMAGELGIPYRTLAEEHKEDKRAYFQRLSRLIYQKVHGQPILLILDNAEEATKALIDASLANRPQSVQVVITTRASRLFRGYEHVLLHAFSPAEGAAYLQQRFSSMGRPLEEAMQKRLLSEVGLIPQPLALATGYLEEYETKSVAGYLDRLQSIRGGAVEAGEEMVLPQVALGLEGLASAAQQVLRYGAYLDADYMPLALFTSLVGAAEEVDSCVTQLGRLSLVTVVRKEGEEVGIQIHREVQKACRQYEGWQEEAALEEPALLQRLVGVLSERMPWVEQMPDERWATGALYAPHAAAVLGEHARGARASLSPCEAYARLLARLGHYRDVVQSNFEEAKDYLEEALAMNRALYPINHSDVAASLNNLGNVYHALGQLQEAKVYQEQALAMRRALHPGNHPEVAASMSNLGLVYEAQGQLQEAKDYQEEALAMRRALHPGNHPDVAASLNNLGNVYQDMGQLQEAKDYQEEALAMRRALHPGNHPDVAASLNNLGNVYQDMGQLQEAKDYQEQALEMFRALHPGNHPEVATSLNNLGSVYQDMGQLQEAKVYQEQALEMFRALHPGNHPEVATSLNNLGSVYKALGQLQEAKDYQEQALEMKRALHPGNHPEVAMSLNNLGLVYHALGQLQEAKDYAEQALAMLRALHPGNHPAMAASLNNLGLVYKDMGQLQEAKDYAEQALAMRRALHPGNHPEVALSLGSVGSVYEALRDNTTALNYYQEALTMFEHVLPAHHRYIQMARRGVQRMEAKLARPSCSIS